jgi:FkbM family methyltransferase
MNSFLTKWNRRPFPCSWSELKNVRTSWSQFAEDLIATQLLGYEKTDGFYVDVGCFDPVTYSNTFMFYRRGWSGVCIDPNPKTAAAWRNVRPRDTMVTAAISQRAGEALYAEFDSFPACNRVLPGARPERIRDLDPKPDRVSSIPVNPLGEILRNHVPAGNRVNLMSIDCEGLDLEVLQSNDFKTFTPEVLIIEDHDLSPNSAIAQFASTVGLRFVAQALISKIFVAADMPLSFAHGELRTA